MATGYGSPVGGAVVGGFAPVVYSSPLTAGSHVDSNILVEWDLDNDGVFETPEEDVTAYVIAAETFTGRDWPSNLQGQASAGRLRLTLLNDDDRFSYFNADSPLNQDGKSLRTGRKIRIRTAESTPVDPRLLARDRFNRSDGPLFGTSDELGNAWDTDPLATHTIVNQQLRGDGAAGESYDNEVSLGNEPNMFAQVTLASSLPITGGQRVTLMVREHGSPRNAVIARFRPNDIILAEQVNGAFNTLGTFEITPWEGSTLGLSVDEDDVATAWFNGIPVIVTGTSVPATGSDFSALVFSEWEIDYRSPPIIDNFYVWDTHVMTSEGVIWTGDITEVNVSVTPGGTKLATVDASGVLARAASAQVSAPQVINGARTGFLVGDVFSRSDVHNPPCEHIEQGYVETGPVYLDDTDALSLARQFENTEFGFIFETPEGPPGFQSRTSRMTASSTGWWTDTPGQGQYEYSGIEPLDYQREVVNRVTAGVAADAPGGISISRQSNGTASGVQNHVDVVIPTVQKRDLLVVFIASTVQNAAVEWLIPIWWFPWRDAKFDVRMRLYDHICDGSESGSTVRFYDDSTSTGGAWIAHVYRVRNWFEGMQGTDSAQPREGRIPPPIEPKWGHFPTLYLTAMATLQSFGPAPSVGDLQAPSGYEDNDVADSMLTPSVSAGAEAGLYTAYRITTGGVESPVGGFSGLDNFVIYDSLTYAVRGFNGDFPDPTSLTDTSSGGEGRFVTEDDTNSQSDHNAIVSYTNAGNLFDNESDAEEYVDLVLDTYADDRPIIALTFPASKRAELREQAFTRRVGDKITVTANGSTGLGFERDFFIESISHRWANGGKTWDCTWELSPA